MNDAPLPTPVHAPALQPLPYLQDVVQYLREHEPDVWRWALSATAQAEHAEAVRNELLRQTYRLDEAGHPDLHRAARTVAGRLGLDVPVVLYQASDGPMNAALFYLPSEAHVVFSGPMLERLQEAELEALLGHELAHHRLWSCEAGQYHAADRILAASAADPRASAAHVHTARLYRLFTEAYADRGALVGCGALAPAITALVKTRTGLSQVNADSYLRQADEIVSKPGFSAAGDSHPEVFVRARAMRLWRDGDAQADAWLAGTLRGPLDLSEADLMAQQALGQLTRRVLQQMLRPTWMRSEATLAHARCFFPDFQPSATADDGLTVDLAAAPACHDYVATLLLDLATVDRDLADGPLAAALALGRNWNLTEALDARVLRDLKLTKRQLQKLHQNAAQRVQQAEAPHA